MMNSINVSVLRGSGMNDSIYGGGSGLRKSSSPLTREIEKAQSGYRDSADQFKQVNFSLVTNTNQENTPTATISSSMNTTSPAVPTKK